MATEIERKFLVANDLWRNSVIGESAMKQGYIANKTDVSVRVRIANGKARLTIKGASNGLERAEFEYEIPLDDANAILEQMAERPFIDKTRYLVQSGVHTWELDVFAGDNAGLVVAEVELQSADEAIELPPWVGEEVSEDPRYLNANLVRHPYTRW